MLQKLLIKVRLSRIWQLITTMDCRVSVSVGLRMIRAGSDTTCVIGKRGKSITQNLLWILKMCCMFQTTVLVLPLVTCVQRLNEPLRYEELYALLSKFAHVIYSAWRFTFLHCTHILKVDEVVMKNGYAFINFSTRDHAVAGKAFADRQIALIVNGTPIRVRYSPDRAHSTVVLAKNAPICNPQVEPSKNLHVCGLPPQVTQEALGEIFR